MRATRRPAGKRRQARRAGHCSGVIVRPPYVRVLNLLRQRPGGAQLLGELLAYVVANESRFTRGRVLDPKTGRGVVRQQIRQVLTLNDMGPFERIFVDEIRRQLKTVMPLLHLRRPVNPKIEIQLTASNDGAHFSRHRDTDSTGTRVVSFVYYFHRSPRRFSGGELRLFADRAGADGHSTCHATASPRHDSVIFFPSLTEHEVRRVRLPSRLFGDSRFTITGWVNRLPRSAK